MTGATDLTAVYAQQAIKHDLKGDAALWRSALFCSRVVGAHERGISLQLADEMGRSVDTVEDRAHAYWLFEKLCAMSDGTHRRFVFLARRAPYVKLSHFRALYDIQSQHNLTDEEILNLLMDIVQAEGSISSRNLQDHARDRYGDGRDWTYFASKAMREIHKTLQQPDLPSEVRKVLADAFEILGDRA
jgi:hypothetical protein